MPLTVVVLYLVLCGLTGEGLAALLFERVSLIIQNRDYLKLSSITSYSMPTMPLAASLRALESTLSPQETIQLGEGWAREKQQEQPLVACTLQVLYSMYPRMQDVSRQTDFEAFVQQWGPTVDLIRQLYPDTSKWNQLVRSFPPVLTLLHYSRSVSTCYHVCQIAPDLIREMKNRGTLDLATADVREGDTELIGTHIIRTTAGLWVSIDQLSTRPETQARGQELAHLMVAGVAHMNGVAGSGSGV